MSSVAGPVTVLFTDLVNSAELLQRGDDERAQRILRAHHTLLKHAVAAHGAQEVKWLGDGFVSVFVSTADAVRCAIALQQAARRRAAGERLSVRVGLHVAETLRDETDYFGTPVAIARRLCERAEGGQILCSGLVAGLLAGQHANESRVPDVQVLRFHRDGDRSLDLRHFSHRGRPLAGAAAALPSQRPPRARSRRCSGNHRDWAWAWWL